MSYFQSEIPRSARNDTAEKVLQQPAGDGLSGPSLRSLQTLEENLYDPRRGMAVPKRRPASLGAISLEGLSSRSDEALRV